MRCLDTFVYIINYMTGLVGKHLRHYLRAIEELIRDAKEEHPTVDGLIEYIHSVLGVAISIGYHATQHWDHFDEVGTYAIVLFLGRAGSTQRFAIPAAGVSLVLHPGDVVAYSPFILHGCESMHGVKDGLKDGENDRVLVSIYVNKLTLAKLRSNGYAAKYKWD